MRARRVRGKSSEEAEEENSPLVTRGYRESGFYPKGKEKLLKGFGQDRGLTCLCRALCVGLREAGIMRKNSGFSSIWNLNKACYCTN